MTGFARATVQDTGGAAWTWELRSVNGRSLEVRSRLPAGLDHLEAQLRAAAAKRLSRGNVSVTLSSSSSSSGPRLRLNRAALDDVLAIVREIQGEVEAAAPRLDGLLGLRGVLDSGETELTLDDKAALAAFDEALRALAAARADEGKQLERHLTAHLDAIERLTAEAGVCAGAQPAAIKARLQAQIADLLDGGTMPAERVAQEAALLATRADIREELDRLKAHIVAARALLRESAAIGRKLDFLSQEFNREANTLCSKSSDIELTRIGLALKAEIDRLREQAANIE